MNHLTVQQRKLVYLAAIGFLLVPIILLGRPSTAKKGSGGFLAQMKEEKSLGEDNLGDVDPSSATMNLVLLGFRGIATNVLWRDAMDYKDRKQWGQLKTTVNSIVLLQPHYEQVWRFQGWNLAYNVSAEWDGVEDRYYWVKEGGKFLQRGCNRNRSSSELLWDVGDRIYSFKIGKSDEWVQFRQFFRKDPDTKRYPNGIDGEFVPEGLDDNFLVAKDWFRRANETQTRFPLKKHVSALYVFRSHRAHAQINYAQTLYKEGTFNEKSLKAWEEAYENWTQQYRNGNDLGFGQEKFESLGMKVHCEMDSNEIAALAKKLGKNNFEVSTAVDYLQSDTNYRYWRTLTLAEKDENTLQAHRDIWQGQQLYRRGKNKKAIELLHSGMQKFEKMLRDYTPLKIGVKAPKKIDLNKPEYLQSLDVEELTTEEALTALIYWRNAYNNDGGRIPPENYPLKAIWNTHIKKEKGKPPVESAKLIEMRQKFERESEIALEVNFKKN